MINSKFDKTGVIVYTSSQCGSMHIRKHQRDVTDFLESQKMEVQNIFI